MRTANDCSIRGIRAELVLALLMCERAIDWTGCQIILTSITDGQHMEGSLHYVGLAGDFVLDDTLALVQTNETVVRDIDTAFRECLECEWDVIKYDDELRWHIEFQPKRRMP